MNRFLKTSIIISFFIFLLFPSLLFAFTNDDLYDGAGFDNYRETHSTMPDEQIDPFTGGLTLSHVDFRLPGNGGLDLVIQRTFNSKNVCNGWTCVGSTCACEKGENTWLGYGWTLHFGRLFKSYNVNIPHFVEMSDGSRHAAYTKSGSSYITKDYWLLDLGTSYVLTLTNGTKIYYGQAGPSDPHYPQHSVYYATKIQDANGNEINIYYKSSGSSEIDYVIDSVGRNINFTTSTINSATRLTSISGPGVSITYTHQSQTTLYDTILTKANLPVGNPWEYTYNNLELASVKTPYGGILSYSYDFSEILIGGSYFYYRTVVQKIASGRDVPSGTWNFSYSQGSYKEYTQISDPCGRTIKYSYYGYGSTYLYDGSMWKIGLPKSKEIVGEETTTYDWTNSSYISTDDYIMPTGHRDNYIYVPLLTIKSITRDGKTYATNYSYVGDNYGNPTTISESGDKTRTTTRTYWNSISKNIVQNKPSLETVSGGFSGSFTTNFSYDANGNLTQLNKYGVVSNYSYYSNGNLYSTTDANNKITYYQWDDGRISQIRTPEYTINRNINSNGTIASETNGRSYTTYFGYDGNLRLTSIDLPAGNTTSFSYPTDNSYKKETRGSYYTYYYYDGFGRASGTSDIKGIDTDIVYKSCGLKNYTTSNIGDTTYFDNFGRMKQIVHKDSSDVTYSYSFSNVVVNDEAGYNTNLTYNAFGNPDEKLLVSVRDALSNTTSYDYNILGSLTDITQGSITRSFSHNSKNFLNSETHPEKGTTTYGRDNVGNMTSKSDSLGTTSYTYDGVNRLTQINYGTGNIIFTYDGASNRTSMDNSSAAIDYTYDPANRLTGKDEQISGRSYTTSYTYDGNDNITYIYYPSGRYVTYAYNSNNQVTSVTNFGKSITGISYYTSGTPTGLLKSFTYSSGPTTTLTYNSRNLIGSIKSGTSVLDLGFNYDSRGNTTSISDYLDGSKYQSFSYDDLNRLASFDGSWGTGAYSYSASGNRLIKSVAGANTNYNYSNNRLTSTTGGEPFSFGYNNDGDVTTLNGYTLQYDRLHNLTSHQSGAQFTYDGDGMRVTKTAGGKTTVYHYDKDGRVISENDENGNFIADYIYLYGKLAAKVVDDTFLPPNAPTNLTATAGSQTQINLSWINNSTNESGFKIERKTGAGGTYSQIATVGANVTTYSDTGLTPETTYYYRVMAYSAGGDSAYSNEANATTSDTPQPNITVSPLSYNFGNVSVGRTSTAQVFSVSNIGTANLVIGTISITGTHALEFSKPADNCTGQTLLPSGSCTVQVVFSPASLGTKNANLSIPSNDPDMPTSDVPLSGTGVTLQYTLTVNKTGTGTGTVTSSPAGINCGTDCSEGYAPDTVVTLTATPDTGSTFTGWSGGGCTGTGTCVVTMNADVTITATFTKPVTGETIQLPETGQKTSYAIGDDGYMQAGVAWPSPRFNDNGDGTITDNLTGLMWLKDANCVKTNYPTITELASYGLLTWYEGLTFISWVNAGIYPLCGAGYHDWRLPNAVEFESLFNADATDPASWLNTQGFTNVQSFYYWTSTTHAYNTDWAWNWINGSSGAGISKNETLHIWQVRGTTSGPAKLWKTGQTISYAGGDFQVGVEWPSPRFTVNVDTTVTDNLTGLSWVPDAGTPTIGICTGGTKTWQEALDYVACLNTNTYLGYTDWRLPNRKELFSLMDFSQQSPALQLGHPFTNVQNGYWSSSTDASNTSNAWLVGMWGSLGGGSKGTSLYVWPVRGGSFNLVISKTGSGTGTVTSSDGKINCGSDCSESYISSTQVTLTATPDTDSTFKGWSGGGCSGTGTCVVTLNNDVTVTATFDLTVPLGITVASPDGGENWQAGTTQTIRWSYSGNGGSTVKIELLKNGAVNREIIKSTSIGSGGSGSYDWSISSSQTPGNDYQVRVTSSSNSTYTDTSDNNFTISSAPGVLSISGKVTDSGGVGIQGVTMTLGGNSSGTTTTDSSGNYSFTGLASGNYTITPSKDGYTFTPTSRNVTIRDKNVSGQDFIGTPTGTTYSISGTVTSESSPLSGVTMTLSGAGSGTTTTDANGNYIFTELANGSYTVTPSKAGYTFSPTSRNVTISGANMAGEDFTGTGTGTSYSISGTVTSNLGLLSGATMTLSGDAADTTTTDSSGNYSFPGLSDGNYTVTPSRTTCSFTPSSRSVTISGADIIGQDFTGKCKY